MSTDHAARRPTPPATVPGRAGPLLGRQLTLGFLPGAPGAPLRTAALSPAGAERPRPAAAAGQPQRELPIRR